MIVRSILYSIATLTIVLGFSGTPASVSKAAFSDTVYTYNPKTKAVIFDLGKVLIQTHSLKAFSALYIPDVLYYMTVSRTAPHAVERILKAKFYAVLDTIEPSDPKHAPTIDDKGNVLPELLHQWLAGIKSPDNLKKQILTEIDNHTEWFAYDVEKRIITRMVEMIFTPALFAQTQKVMDGAIEFVQECKNRGYAVYILSNWDAESIRHVADNNPNLFSLFDGMIISGEELCTKPDIRIYKRLLKRYHLRAHECIFIDDQPNNVASARSCGINAIVCPQKGLISYNTDFDALRFQII